jgi:malonate transporter and related proteins
VKETFITVLSVCAPLFSMLFLGYWLRRRGSLNEQAHTFISGFVYRYSLPVLIFPAVAAKPLAELLDPVVLVSTIGVTFFIVVTGLLIARPLKPTLRGPAISVAFLANTAYIGFPLARNAFGDAGFEKASIVNAFVLPTFVTLGVLLLTGAHAKKSNLWQKVKPALFSPVFMAALLGIVASLLIHSTPPGRALAESKSVLQAVEILMEIIKPIGAVGLPLALLAVGASLKLHVSLSHKGLAIVCTLLKLVVAPALTLLVCRLAFPDADPVAVGTAVLLMACPLSVAFYVISAEFDAEPDFVATLLATTTIGSCITIPLWVALLV